MASTDPIPQRAFADATDPAFRVIDLAGTPDWRVGLAAHLLRLDPEERRTRFLASIGEAGIRAHAARADPLALVVFAPDGVWRGVAELYRGAGPGVAEIAVSVEHGWQNRGFGATLTARATQLARAAGLWDVRLICLRRNLPMLRIAEKLAAHALPVADWALALFRLETAEQP